MSGALLFEGVKIFRPGIAGIKSHTNGIFYFTNGKACIMDVTIDMELNIVNIGNHTNSQLTIHLFHFHCTSNGFPNFAASLCKKCLK